MTDRIAVVTYPVPGQDPQGHEAITRAGLAHRIAALKSLPFAGEYAATTRYGGPLYFVPGDTLVGCAEAAALGIDRNEHLFGAVVPHAFVATKSITHPLVDDDAVVPAGWTAGFAAAVADAVLDGYSAFARDDARRAALRMLAARGELRLKRATGIGGGGQHVVRTPGELDAALEPIDDDELARYGVVLEENLADVVTFSVGRVDVAGMVATYCGTQTLTPNNHGVHVYGGSTIMVVRGEYEVLLGHALAPEMREAVDLARRYDRAADAHFAGFVASRRNYDVARGIDRTGAVRAGVLEQSWRMGGASGAEVGALEAFQRDPALHCLRAACTERYGEGVQAPPGASVYYDAVDARVGRLIKYTIVEIHGDAR